MAKIAGRLRLDLAQYRELAVFSRFGSDLDSSTQEQLNQGVRLTKALVQGQYCPMPMAHQVVLLYVVTNKMLLDIDEKEIGDFIPALIEALETKCPQVIQQIQMHDTMDDEAKAQAKQAVNDFKLTWQSKKES